MPYKEHYYTKFDEGNYYHIYNRSVDRKPMFKSEENFKYFLRKYNQYLSGTTDTYAFCLLEDHFHFLIRVQENLSSKFPDNMSTHEIVSHQYQKFFQCYAMAFNTQYDRVGTLFQTPFKRALIDNEKYLTQLVYYIHSNPEYHGLIENFRDWKWSSYKKIFNGIPSKLRKQDVLNWFGGKDEYINFHSVKSKVKLDYKYRIEDE